MNSPDSTTISAPQFLSRPMLWLLFASAAALILGLIATEWWLTRMHNKEEIAAKARQVEVALQSLDEIQRGSLIDYAVWDDAYRAIRSNYHDWQTDNIGSAVSGVGASTDMHVIVPRAGRPSYGWVAGHNNVPSLDVLNPEIVANLIEQIAEKPADPPAFASSYEVIDGDVWRLMATRVIPNNGAPEGVADETLPRLISGVRLSGRYLDKISQQVGIEDLQIILGDVPDWSQDSCQQLVSGADGAWICWTPILHGDSAVRTAALPFLVLSVVMVLALGVCLWQILRAARELEHAMIHALRADSAKTEFLATVTHELRTPLNGVLGIGEILRNTSLSNRQRDMLEVMMRSGKGLLELINDLLDVARIEAGNLELSTAPVDICGIMKAVTELLGPTAEQRDIKLLIYAPKSPIPEIMADGRALRQIMINLIGNAIKFTDEGQVSVTTIPSVSGDQVQLEIRVSDTGRGISPENLTRVFDRFFQERRTSARQIKGSGLGLSITAALINAMGGTIEVDSAPGKGSTFRLRLKFERANSTAKQLHAGSAVL